MMVGLLFFVILAACTNTRDNVQNNNQPKDQTQPINFHSSDKQKTRPDLTNNPYRDDNPARYSDAFTNEESIQISKTLEHKHDIMQAQVASTEDRVIVSLILNDHTDHEVTGKLQREIQEMVPDKQIIIYTDDPHWERMKNMDTKLKAHQFGDDILDFFDGRD